MKTRINSIRPTKPIAAIILPVVILTLAAFTKDKLKLVQEIKNQVENFQENVFPNGWFLNGANPQSYKTGIDNQIAQNGQKSAFIESVVSAPEDFCTLMQTCVHKEFRGKRLKMTGYIKSQGTAETASMWVRVDDIGKKMFTDFDNMQDRSIVGNSEWTKCEIIFDAPEKGVIFYGFIMNGAGKIWVDNVSFEIIDNSIAKTAFSLDEPFPNSYLEQLMQQPQDQELPQRLPVNLDFEE